MGAMKETGSYEGAGSVMPLTNCASADSSFSLQHLPLILHTIMPPQTTDKFEFIIP